MNDLHTANQELAFDEVEMEVPSAGGDYETIPAGVYPATLIGFRVVDKPDWKLTGDEGEDKQQWEWTFEIPPGEYQNVSLAESVRLTDWTNRTLHEKATAHKHTAALLGLSRLEPSVTVKMKLLRGKSCQLWVTEKATKKDPNTLRNFIDKVTPAPKPRAGRTPAPATNKRVQLDGYPSDDEGGDIEF